MFRLFAAIFNITTFVTFLTDKSIKHNWATFGVVLAILFTGCFFLDSYIKYIKELR